MMKTVAARLTIAYISLIVISLMFTTQAAAKIDPKSIVGIWLLDEGEGKVAKDLSENGNDGKVTGAKWVAGQFGSALEFNGNDDSYVEVPDSEKLEGMSQITVVTWAKFDKFPKPGPKEHYAPVGKEMVYRFIIGQAGAGHFVVATVNNGWYTPGTVASGNGLKTGQWIHLAGTYDGNFVQFYIDGQLAGKGPQKISGNLVNKDIPFHMAKTIAGNVSFFEGLIDDVAIFNVALTEDDIQTIMAKGLAKALGFAAVSPAGKLTTTWASIKAH